jgi:hypothetical protein
MEQIINPTDRDYPATFDLFMYEDGEALLKNRRTKTAQAASKFFDGDAWQGGDGFIGQLPPSGLTNASEIKLAIEAGFVSENVIKEVAETHVGGVMGREPLWSFANTKTDEKVDEKEYESLTRWWNDNERLDAQQRGVKACLLEEIVVKHIYIPKGLVKKGGDGKPEKIKAADLGEALGFIYCENLAADKAGVFIHPDTHQRIGVRLYCEDKKDFAEFTYLDEQGDTVLRVVGKDGVEVFNATYPLGGRLLIYEMRRDPLITPQVLSMQKSVNLAHTMMMRNVNLAGSRERSVSNAQEPRGRKKIQDPDNPTRTKVSDEPGYYVVGAGGVNWLLGYPIRNANGEVVGYTNPNVSVTDPVAVTTFTQTRDHFYAAILGECAMRHLLISGDAVASGRSRKQAEKEYERSLKKTKVVADGGGRWELETVLRLAAKLCDQTTKFVDFRADFNCMVDASTPTPEERQADSLDVDKGRLSLETYSSRYLTEDTAAEKARIEEEAKGKPKPPPPPTNQPPTDETGRGASA